MPTSRLPLRRISALDLELCVRCNRASRYTGARALFRAASRLGDGVFWYAVLGLHYPSDVLAGAALGGGLAALVLAL